MSEVVENNAREPGSSENKSGQNNIASCFSIIGIFWAMLLLVDRLASWPKIYPFFAALHGQAVLVAAAAILFFAAWKNKSRIYRLLTSYQFAVALLGWLMLVTVVGTFIVQGSVKGELDVIYGSRLAGLIWVLGLNDLFHSLWFGGLLLLLTLSLVLVVIRRRAWRLNQWGVLFSHLGVVLIIAGGFVGYFFGFKGFMDLHEGRSSGEAAAMELGRKTGEKHRLGFDVRLQDFSIQNYDPEYKLYLYRSEEGGFTADRTFDPADVGEWTEVEPGIEFRVVNTYPDFFMRDELEIAKGDQEARPGVRLTVHDMDGVRTVSLLAGAENSSASVSERLPLVTFTWDPPTEEEIAARSSSRPASHIIVFEDKDCCPEEEIEVDPRGGTWSLGGDRYELRVLEYLPDFVYDTETRKAETRSETPNNPALEVSIGAKGSGEEADQRWLFAKMPDFGMSHGKEGGGAKLTYRFEQGTLPSPAELIIVGSTREGISLENGSVIGRSPLEGMGTQLAKAGIIDYKVIESARRLTIPDSRSQEWKNPVVEVEVKSGGETMTRMLSTAHNDPLWLVEGKTALTFARKQNEVKAYNSLLAVLENGKPMVEKRIAVNEPLDYKGYRFYQSSFREDDPTYSGILVVHDPGLPVVWTGLIMICAGVAFVYYLRPRLIRSGKNA